MQKLIESQEQQQPDPHVILKMSRSMLGLLARSNRDISVPVVKDAALVFMRCLVHFLSNPIGNAVSDMNRAVELLAWIKFVLLKQVWTSKISHELNHQLIESLYRHLQDERTLVRTKSMEILTLLARLHRSSPLALRIFDVSLEMLLDQDHSVLFSPIIDVLHEVSAAPLLFPQLVAQDDAPDNLLVLSEAFSLVDFESVLRLMNTQENDPSVWFAVCRRIHDRILASDSIPVLSKAASLLIVIRHAALWCVQNRLRTHLGGPAQIFAYIERLLVVYGSSRSQETMTAELQLVCTSESPVQQLWNLSSAMTLEFVMALETFISHEVTAETPDTVNSESESYKVSLFFRTNRKVCDDWLCRIRPLLLEISQRSGCTDLIRHHAQAMVYTANRRINRILGASAKHAMSEELFEELINSEKEMDGALFTLCCCDADAKDADSIAGMHSWGQSLSTALTKRYREGSKLIYTDDIYLNSGSFVWMKAVWCESEMKYEEAISEYEVILSPIVTNDELSSTALSNGSGTNFRMSSTALLGCIRHLAKCYVAVRDWSKLRTFVVRFLNYVESLEANKAATDTYPGLLEYASLWRGELDQVCILEAEDMQLKLHRLESSRFYAHEDLLNGAALQKWDNIEQTDEHFIYGSTAYKNQDFGSLIESMGMFILNPTSTYRYPCVRTKITKASEKALIAIGGTSIDGDKLPPGINIVASMASSDGKLDESKHDSTSWSQPLYDFVVKSQALSFDVSTRDMLSVYLTRTAKLARKQRNFCLADRLLNESSRLVASLKAHDSLLYEKSLLLYDRGNWTEGLRSLQELCDPILNESRMGTPCGGIDDPRVRPILRLASALHHAATIQDFPLSPSFASKVPVLIDALAATPVLVVDHEMPPDYRKELCGQLLFAATQLSPASAKVWLRYSNWCYEQSICAIDLLKEQSGYISLSADEELELLTLMNALHIDEEYRETVMRQFRLLMDENEFVIHNRYDQFHLLCMDISHSREIDSLLALQKKCHSNALRFQKLAARGYGLYLSCMSSVPVTTRIRAHMVTAALRVLHLLTAYGGEPGIAEELDAVFTQGPLGPWCELVPQLVARNAHPIPMVSSLISSMLKRLAQHAPHLVVYPVIADSLASSKITSDESSSPSTTSLDPVLRELQCESASLVNEIRLLVLELQRISILWDEAWISGLMKLSADVSRRTSTLEKEAARVDKNASLSAGEKSELARRKFVAIMRPILVALEKLWAETCGRVETQPSITPHERQFLQEYGMAISKALARFRECFNLDLQSELAPNVVVPSVLWNPFAEILKALMNSAGRRDHLPLKEISPMMATIASRQHSTNLPGVFSMGSNGFLQPVSIQSIGPVVTVLKTKTKPKCLTFVGSNGKSYKYLLKAREDLHLDERIMQFLTTVNMFLSSDNQTASRGLSAQHYSVIPLSHDAGLIQMVPDVIPLFQVYTNRNDQIANARNHHTSPPSNGNSAHENGHGPQQMPPPPTAAFYSKLKQYGVSNVSPNHRSQWPHSVLKTVFQDLVVQRPRNILQDELILRSNDLRESWLKGVAMSKSLAVMSVLGYIVGLGDRHLDNILLCVKSGEIVHIDYNVCFDKGQKLKVPEVVPFRLTPMLQDALGLTGVEGTFRAAFENTLRVIRGNESREALLTLLEAFVYDPLADWTSESNRHGSMGDLKARLEVNVNLSLFLSRAEERRQETLHFGRQFGDISAALSQATQISTTRLGLLFQKITRTLSLKMQEQHTLKAISALENQIVEALSLRDAAFTEMNNAMIHYESVHSKLSHFADECLARHRQIEIWRQKSLEFARQNVQIASFQSNGSTSFQAILNNIYQVASRSSPFLPSNELLALYEKSQIVDRDVLRHRHQLEMISDCLRPYLVSYGRLRQELDEFISSASGTSGRDVYEFWYKKCVEIANQTSSVGYDACSSSTTITAVSRAQASEARRIINSIERVWAHPDGANESEEEQRSSFSSLDERIQDLSSIISSLKLSNAQGQRMMKLASGSWMVYALQRIENSRCNPTMELSDSLPFGVHPLFRTLLGIAKSGVALSDLVSTPKGSMKRIRAIDLVQSQSQVKEQCGKQVKSLVLYCEVMQSIQHFVGLARENVFLDRHGIHSNSDHFATATQALKEALVHHYEIQGSFEEIWRSSVVTLDSAPAIQELFAAVASIIHKLSNMDELPSLALRANSSVDTMIESVSKSWANLLVSVCDGLLENIDDVLVLALTFIADFTAKILARLLEQILRNTLANEWKLDFTNEDVQSKERLQEQWDAVVTSQVPDIFLSANLPSGAAEKCFSSVSTVSMEIMRQCELLIMDQWQSSETEHWNSKLVQLQRSCQGKLRYFSWLSQDDPNSLTQGQLLSVMSTQIGALNHLMADQTVVESSVLELAQQLEYIASQLSQGSTKNMNSSSQSAGENAMTEESLYGQVQSCYRIISSVFEYARSLADLVQGISVLETSSRAHSAPVAQSVAMEVDHIGKTLIEDTRNAGQILSSQRTKLADHEAIQAALEKELAEVRRSHDSIVASISAQEQSLMMLCEAQKNELFSVAQEITAPAKSLLHLLTSFQKLKTLSKDKIMVRPSLVQVRSDEPMDSFSFMENERLVKILLKSIKSVKALKGLENVLDRHERDCVKLHDIIARLCPALRNLLAELPAQESEDLPTSFLAVARGGSRPVSTQTEAQSMTIARALVQFTRALGFPLAGDSNTQENLLEMGAMLVNHCFDLFFEATELADRFSSTAVSQGQTSSSTDENDLQDDDDGISELSNSLSASIDVAASSAYDKEKLDAPAQEQNRYGLQVLKRIQDKLSGHVDRSGTSAGASVFTVEQQASWLIEEATKVDNLCVMYEGWTPWI